MVYLWWCAPSLHPNARWCCNCWYELPFIIYIAFCFTYHYEFYALQLTLTLIWWLSAKEELPGYRLRWSLAAECSLPLYSSATQIKLSTKRYVALKTLISSTHLKHTSRPEITLIIINILRITYNLTNSHSTNTHSLLVLKLAPHK